MKVWSPYDENVVKAAISPMRIIVRRVGLIRNLSSVKLKIAPVRRHPIIFTAIVPHGNVSPYWRATNPESQYLKRVPVSPARPIRIVLNIVFISKRDMTRTLDRAPHANS